MKFIFIVLFIFPFQLAFPQNYIQSNIQSIIYDDTIDSIFIKASFSDRGFDKNGNYFFQIRKNDIDYIYCKDTIIGPLNGTGSTNMEFFSYENNDNKSLHRKITGKNIYGPFLVDEYHSDEYLLSLNSDTMAVITKAQGNYHFYLNNDLIFTTSISTDEPYWFNRKEWICFGLNGDILFVKFLNGVYNLYKNDSLIESSKDKITYLGINNKGEYIYAIQKDYWAATNKKIYSILKYKNKEFLVNGGSWDYNIDEKGNFIFSGFLNGSTTDYFKFINGYYRDGFQQSDYVTVENDTNFFYTCNIDKQKYFIHGQTAYKDVFDTIFVPSIDSSGNFALLGIKNYYLYKYVNGNIVPAPITGFNRRPSPIYISPQGDAIYYYKFRDSVLIYNNSDLIFKSSPENFISEDLHDSYVSPLRFQKKRNNFRFLSLKYLQLDNKGYVIYNGKFSVPMLPFLDEKWGPDYEGEIVSSGIYENKFFLVQCQAKGRYLININNETYSYLENFDEIFEKQNYFDGKDLTLFGRRGREFVKINLQDE